VNERDAETLRAAWEELIGAGRLLDVASKIAAGRMAREPWDDDSARVCADAAERIIAEIQRRKKLRFPGPPSDVSSSTSGSPSPDQPG